MQIFSTIKAKLQDMGTIKQLCELAEANALSDRQSQPGAEHFLLAALALGDGTARRAFVQSGVDPDGFRAAIDRQYSAALESIGIAVDQTSHDPEFGRRRPASGVYHAAPSGQEVMQRLADTRDRHSPLLGAHVVAIVAAMPHGVAARAFRALGVDPARLRATAEEIAGNRPATASSLGSR